MRWYFVPDGNNWSWRQCDETGYVVNQAQKAFSCYTDALHDATRNGFDFPQLSGPQTRDLRR
jgi:hypothetical protein